jgi:four helix bundle protein
MITIKNTVMTNKVEFVKQFQSRTKQLALNAIKIYQTIPKNEEGKIIGRQFLRAALSVGANYRAVCRARSRPELFAKLCITVEESDEVLYWTEVLTESDLIRCETVSSFAQEASEILAVLSTARKNAR